MGSVMDKWFGFDPPKVPKPAPPAPKPTPETEAAEDMLKRLRKKRGRASTIIAGDLEPMDVGKRSLLG